MTLDSVAYLMTYELHVLDVYVYGTSNAVLYCMDSTLQRLRAVCAATARLLLYLPNLHIQCRNYCTVICNMCTIYRLSADVGRTETSVIVVCSVVVGIVVIVSVIVAYFCVR